MRVEIGIVVLDFTLIGADHLKPPSLELIPEALLESSERFFGSFLLKEQFIIDYKLKSIISIISHNLRRSTASEFPLITKMMITRSRLSIR
jgi:hypothetical protein